MSHFVFEADKEKILDALDDNIIFSSVFNCKDFLGNIVKDPRTEWKNILENYDFIDIWREIIDRGNIDTSITATDIVFCMCPEKNKSNEDLHKIYDLVGYQAHGNEQPVFFVDNTFSSTRNDGTLFTTKGIYRKNKGMIAYSPNMSVEVNTPVKELYIKNTRVLAFKGTKNVFEDIVDLANIVYLFNCIRHDESEEVYNRNIYEGVWKKDADGNMHLDKEKLNQAIKEKNAPDNGELNDKGIGENSSQSGCVGLIILIVIIILVFKSCS